MSRVPSFVESWSVIVYRDYCASFGIGVRGPVRTVHTKSRSLVIGRITRECVTVNANEHGWEPQLKPLLLVLSVVILCLLDNFTYFVVC